MCDDIRGFTLIDVLVTAALVTILLGMTIPQVTIGLERARARAAARYLTSQMALARTQAVGRGAVVALRFQQQEEGIRLSVVVDGNRNGVLTRDIDNGVDRTIQPPVRLEELFPGVIVGVPAESSEHAVQLGGTEILSFTPDGTATSGSVYLLGRDASRFAVRVLGVTGRVRLQHFDTRSGSWVDTF